MKVTLYFGASYLFIATGLFVFMLTRSHDTTPGDFWLATSILVSGLLISGLILGAFLSAVFQKPGTEKFFYAAGQLIPLLSLTGWAVYSIMTTPPEVIVNSRENEKTIENMSNLSSHFRPAFQILKTQFQDSNYFLIHDCTENGLDTIVDEKKDTVYKIYFSYSLKNKPHDVRLAKFTFFRDSLNLNYFNLSSDSVKEYQSLLKQEHDAEELSKKYEKDH